MCLCFLYALQGSTPFLCCRRLKSSRALPNTGTSRLRSLQLSVFYVLYVCVGSCTPCGSGLTGFCFDTTLASQNAAACSAIGGTLQPGLCPGPTETICCNNVNAGAQCPGSQVCVRSRLFFPTANQPSRIVLLSTCRSRCHQHQHPTSSCR